MSITRILIALTLFIFSLNMAESTDLIKNNDESKDGNILLQSSKKSSLLEKPNLIEKSISNSSNSNKNEKSNWIFSVNDKSNVHTQALGQPMKINGYANLDNSNIEKAAKDFLFQNRSSFNIDPDALKLIHAKYINNRWYVSFAQYYKGIKVLLSDVELRIFKNGNVFAISSDYYRDINIDLTPSISLENVRNFAVKGLDFVSGKDVLQESKTLYILPVKSGSSTTYKLVYNVDISLKSKNQSYFSYIDANTGDIVWRQSRVFSSSTDLKAAGNIRTKNSFSPENKIPMENQFFTIDNQVYTSDKDGNISVNIDKPTSFETTFSGPYAEVINDDKPNQVFQGTIYPNQANNFLWSDENSIKQQRYVFYYANNIHNYIKGIDPDLNVMDFPLKVTILYDDQYGVNAYSGGKTIQFYGADMQGYHFAETPEILYHEYGHSINSLLYESLGKENGMINMACHEGMADITAALVNDEPKVGIGAFDDSTEIIRNVQNYMKYPNNITGESHNDGQILSGAFWDLRKAVSLDYVRHISHFARYGTPDDIETGLAFSKWLFETVVADDDDGDLTNGTPHLSEIITSFEKHGIYGYIYSYIAFSHLPPESTNDTINPYIMDFTISALPILYTLDSVAVNYSIDNMKTMYKVLAVKNGENNYKAAIPAQPRGTIVKYYFSSWNQKNQKSINYSKDMNTVIPYTLQVGYVRAFFDDFETQKGWQSGDAGDNAKQGKWEWNIPKEAILHYSQFDYNFTLQPGEDHTENGKYCLVTDATGGKSSNMTNYMPVGITTIISPAYDMSHLKNPIINYYRWVLNVPIMQGVSAWFSIEISFDGGKKWKIVENINYTSEWEKSTINVSDFGIPSNNVKLKFIVNNAMTSYGIYSAYSEALVDDFEILTGNDAVISAVEDNPVIITENEIKIYPNPLNTFTNISYNVKNDSRIEIKLINSIGETVSTLLDEYKPAGSYNLEWNVLNNSNMKILPGMYFIQLNSQFETKAAKIIIY
jgi:hypothetical protein